MSSTGAIINACFETHFSNNNYNISISFYDAHSKISEIGFKATPITKITEVDSAFAIYAHLIETSNLSYSCDVQPLNGSKSKKFLRRVVEDHVQDLTQQLTYCTSTYAASQKVNLFVLDAKDRNISYNNIEEIERAEDSFATFLRSPKTKESAPCQTFRGLIKDHGIQFFLREGRLKSHLIKLLPAEQAAFLQKDPKGRERFCQLCEVMLNFFKRGYAIQSLSGSYTLQPREYFYLTLPSQSPPTEFSLSKIHKLPLLTLYPAFYKKLYSAQEEYFQTLNKTFHMEHAYDHPTGTTAITIRN